jgi:hypothetical protein
LGDYPDGLDRRLNRYCADEWGDRQDVPLYRGGPYRNDPYYYGEPEKYRPR